MGTHDNGRDRLLNELFAPTPRPERKSPSVTLYNPWTRMYHRYRLGLAGIMSMCTHGPVNMRDAQRIEQSIGEDGA
ncbi:hypothetical protein KAF44_00750 [Cupriavidus necator]|nr:hypothetical protein KAF44_00750 [Cupriavidus necator]